MSQSRTILDCDIHEVTGQQHKLFIAVFAAAWHADFIDELTSPPGCIKLLQSRSDCTSTFMLDTSLIGPTHNVDDVMQRCQ